jgi:hypothetical protein
MSSYFWDTTLVVEFINTVAFGRRCIAAGCVGTKVSSVATLPRARAPLRRTWGTPQSRALPAARLGGFGASPL